MEMSRLCSEYEEIFNKATTPPVDAPELILLIDYMAKVEKETLALLEKKLVQSKHRMSFLIDYISMSPDDLKLSLDTFSWSVRMPEIIEENKVMVAKKRVQFEEALKVLNYNLLKACLTLIFIVHDSCVIAYWAPFWTNIWNACFEWFCL